MTGPGDDELFISRRIAATPDRVWQAWADPALLARWWLPAPLECRVVALDLRPGGGLETEMREPGGAFGPHVAACVLEAAPGQRLVWTTCLTAGWRPAEPWLALTAVQSFVPDAGGTRYEARVLHRNAEDARRHAGLGFLDGWGTVLGQLAALLDRS